MPPESQDSVEIKMAVSREFVGIEITGGQGISSNYSKKRARSHNPLLLQANYDEGVNQSKSHPSTSTPFSNSVKEG